MDTSEPTDGRAWTSEEVAEKINVPYRTLMRWQQEQLIQPERAGKHQKSAALWSQKNLREARVIATLRSQGVSLQKTRRAMEYLRSIGHNPFSTGSFLALAEGGEVLKIMSDSEALSVLRKPGQRVLLFVSLDDEAEGSE